MSGSFYDTKENRFFPALNRSKQFAYFRNYLADRYTLQTYWEKAHWYSLVPNEDWVKIRTRLRRAEMRHKTLPLDGEKIVIAKEGDFALPVHFKARKGQMDEWLSLAPKGGDGKHRKGPRCGGNRDFGGPYAGSRGRIEKETGRYLHLFQDTGTIENILKITEVKFEIDREDILLKDMTLAEGREYVEVYLVT